VHDNAIKNSRNAGSAVTVEIRHESDGPAAARSVRLSLLLIIF